MVSSVKQTILVLLYIIGIILVYPILLYFLQEYKTVYNYFPLLPYHDYIQVYFSGPGSIVIGAILFFAYKQRIAGLCFSIIGLCWIGAIIHEIITKN